ncbi:MAG TPA: methyltransferase [Pyrinomonadaceae bacterium]
MSATQKEIPSGAGEMPPQMVLLQMITGAWISQLIYVAARLRIADLLKDGPKSADELAQATDSHAPTLYRVLRALASCGIFAEDDAQRFTLTPLAETLQTGPNSLRAMALHLGETPSWHAWGDLLQSVKTGKTAFLLANGVEIFDYYAEHPESLEPFNEAMTNFSETVIPAIVKAYDFSSINKLVDVGGGHGSLLAAILKANPQMTGILFDLEQAAAGARQRLGLEGVADRSEVIAGSFFDSVPAGGDAYLMKHIIHDWDDERATAILKNCHRAMADSGKLLLIEAAVAPGNEPSLGKLMDINMLVLPGGRERTEKEYADLFAAAGFKLTKVTPTESPVSVIEGMKA